jgi:imidazolonepropionase-like amidohydrolase
LIPVSRANGLTSALVVPRGGALCGTSALLHLDGWTHEDMQVAAPVALHIQWPNMTPVRAWFETRSDEEQKKARDEAVKRMSDAFNDARAYANAVSAEGQKGIPRHDRDVKWDGMVRAVRGEIPVMFHLDRLNQIRAALKFADEQGLKKIVLVGASDADLIADELKARDIAVIAGPTLELPNRSWEPYDEAMSQPERLREAGIRFCISNGNSETMNARNLPYQAAMAAAYGLPKDEALKSVTLYPAQVLGVADRLGSIEVGKIADLQVTDGDPLEQTTQCLQVFINGRPIPMTSRQTALFKKYDARPRGPNARKR